MKQLLLLVMLMMVFSSVSATIIHVPGDYQTIQAGINASHDRDTVLVHPGRYFENINFNGHNIVVGSLYILYGETQYRSTTIIDGDSLGSVVTFDHGEDTTAVLIGVTLQNGFAHYGGGILDTADSNPSILYNRIIGNAVYGDSMHSPWGGGIWCWNANPIIRGNDIETNTVYSLEYYGDLYGHGAGICLYSSEAIVADNNIISNIIDGSGWYCEGGGICVRESSPIIVNNVIQGNSAGTGGGIYSGGSHTTIINNTITSNFADLAGGGVRCIYGSGPIVHNNFISQNQAYSGGGVSCAGAGVSLMGNTIINNSACWGGGVDCYNTTSLIANNCIIGNSAVGAGSGYGGGIFCNSSGSSVSPRIINNVVLINSSQYRGGGIAVLNGDFPYVINTILRGNTAPADSEIYLQSSSILCIFSNVQGGWQGSGNIDIDPLFRDTVNGDYHLMAIACGDPFDSPCIDTGIPHFLDNPLDCSWGLGTELSDMGAYSGGDSTTLINVPNELPTIQQALNMSMDGDTILVQPGTYFENINFSGREVTLASCFLTTNDTSYIHNTIIDGQGEGSVVRFENGETVSAQLIGFTIQNGYAELGAGVYIVNAAPTILWNIFRENDATNKGGGMYCQSSYPRLYYNIFCDNAAVLGGAIHCRTSRPFISHSIFQRNNGIYGGVFANYLNSVPTVINSVFYDNNSNMGGAVYCADQSYPVIVNSILWGDSASFGPEIWESSPFDDISYCDVQGGYVGEGTVNVEPNFIDPASGNFHLMAIACSDSLDSPCIDAGRPDLVDDSLDCFWGLGTTRCDIGVYGGGDTLLYVKPVTKLSIPANFSLNPNYPNPFNANTVINYCLPYNSKVSLEIYNILGQHLATLFDGTQIAGEHRLIWNASDFASGIYFCRMSAPYVQTVRKMVLIK